VALVSRAGPLALGPEQLAAVAACLGAALCYGLSAVYLKRRGAGAPAVAIAAWSQMIAGVVLLPIALGTTPNPPLSWSIAANLLVLALLCSGVAYLLYFRLIADLGPTRALLVTFLMPAFGMLWGAAFLGEAITPPMLAGAALVVAGSAAVLRPARTAAVA
jgi:drug/metabolite transporter (DMT)-like permease